jgi:DDE family transposase
MRLKSNRKLDTRPLRTTWPHRYGHAQGNLRAVTHSVLVVKDGRRYWGTNDLTLTPRAVKAHYSHRQQIEETFRLLKQEFGWGGCSCQNRQAQWAHLHLGLYALLLTQQSALGRGQTIYAFRQSLFLQPIPQNLSALQEFTEAA